MDLFRGSGGHSADPEGSHVDCVLALQVFRFTFTGSRSGTGSRPLSTDIPVLARAAKYSALPRAKRAQHPKHSRHAALNRASLIYGV